MGDDIEFEFGSAGIAKEQIRRSSGGSTLDAEYRMPLEWARRADPALDRAPVSTQASALASATSLTGTITLTSGETLDVPVSYVGFREVERRSAYSLERLHAIVMESLRSTVSAWSGWVPDNLEVRFHGTSKSFGLAFEPGKGDRKVSLHATLLADYDAKSVWRVIVHELCHHWREERWPRAQFHTTRSQDARRSHDAKFCEQLALVDDVVASSPERCRFFTDTEDPSIVAAKAEKRVRDVVFTPEAGYITLRMLKTGALRVDWVPDVSAGYGWKTYTVPVTDEGALELAQRFAPADWERVRMIEWPARFAPYLFAPVNLQRLFAMFIRRNYRLPKFIAYVEELSKGTVPP